MITISLCMIVKNEEAVLERCLKSVCGAVDEIIIVDTGSVDKTKEIAAKFTPHIYDFTWIDDFSQARNYAFSLATKDYQMWLDADDVLPEEEKAKLIELKRDLPPQTDVVTMKYHVAFDCYGQPAMTSTRERLLRRAGNFRWQGPIHECITMRGNVFDADIAIWHLKPPGSGDRDRNLRIYEGLLAQGMDFSPRSTYYYARELMDHQRYSEAADYFTKFLEQQGGWQEDCISACLNLGLCYKALGNRHQRTLALLRSFAYDLPRPEICCQIAYDYLDAGDWRRAIYWLETALQAPPAAHGGFVLPDCHHFIPHIELCVCYYHLGDIERALYHNQQAEKIKPQSQSVKQNQQFFQTLLK